MPQNLRAAIRGNPEDVILDFDAPIPVKPSVWQLQRMILVDPRPGVEKNVWSNVFSIDATSTRIVDDTVELHPGAEICWRTRSWNPDAALAGVSGWSEPACVKVEGQLIRQFDWPSNVTVQNTPDGVNVAASGGEGDFTLERRVDDGAWEVVRVFADNEPLDFTDTNVRGQRVCYRFSQHGAYSEETCSDVVIDDGSVALTIKNITRLDDDYIKVTGNCPLRQEDGYLIYFRQFERDGVVDYWRAGSMPCTNGPFEKTLYAPVSTAACLFIELRSAGLLWDATSKLCLPSDALALVDGVPVYPIQARDLQTNGHVVPNDLSGRRISFDALVDLGGNQTDVAKYEIEVAEATSLELIWAPGIQFFPYREVQQNGERTSPIVYRGPELQLGVTYSWRIRLHAEANAATVWSNWVNFTLAVESARGRTR